MWRINEQLNERNTFWTVREGTGRGNIGGWASADTGTDDSCEADDDTWTTSTSLWAVCEDGDEEIVVGPDCNNWPGVTSEGAAISGWFGLDVPTEGMDSDMVW